MLRPRAGRFPRDQSWQVVAGRRGLRSAVLDARRVRAVCTPMGVRCERRRHPSTSPRTGTTGGVSGTRRREVAKRLARVGAPIPGGAAPRGRTLGVAIAPLRPRAPGRADQI